MKANAGQMHVFAAALFGLLTALMSPAAAQDRTYGGFDCTVDCSGHAAGYKWADDHDITDELDCPEGNSQSFHEGCVAYTQDNMRSDPDEDDDGQQVGDEPSMNSGDTDEDDK
jgi:hypothetical protein